MSTRCVACNEPVEAGDLCHECRREISSCDAIYHELDQTRAMDELMKGYDYNES